MRALHHFALGALILGAGFLPITAEAQFTVLSDPARVQIHANGAGPVLVVEQRNYPLPQGATEIAVDFTAAAVQPDSVRVEAKAGQEGLRWISAARAPQQKRQVWRLSSEAATTAAIRLSYLLDRLTIQPHYRLILSPSKTQADLEGRLAIRNDSGASFTNASVHYQQQPIYQGAIQPGETRAIPWMRWTNLPLQRVHVWDAATQPWEPRREQQVQIPVEFRLQNEAAKGLGTTLPAGKYRVLQQLEEGVMFLGEARLPVNYAGQPVVLPVMSGRDLLITQTKARSVDVNLRPNTQRPRLVDVEEQLMTRIDNRQDQAVEVELVQHLQGQWESIESSHPFENRGDGELRFPLTLAAGESVTVTFDYRLRNLQR